MRVNDLLLDNRWRQVYYDLNKDLAGTSGGMEHKEAKILMYSYLS
jgi:hypothetical protein